MKQPISVVLLSYTKILYLLLAILSLALVQACANRGTPSGGDYDLDPPRLLSSTPLQKATHVENLKTIELLFDENVQLQNASENVLITPPQQASPRFTVINRRIKIDLNDSLRANTTYVFDFADALQDNNEGNPMDNFVLTFSTGAEIDTLEISGRVLAANNLEPVSAIYVGLHSNLSDSAFMKLPFDRISRTNAKGEFTIRGVAPGKYHLFALADANRDYKYDSPSEEIAFLDTIVVPRSIPSTRIDTLLKADHQTVDTIIERSVTRFLPENIVLRSFTSSFKKKYLQKYERPNNNQIVLYFTDGKALKHFELHGAKESNSSPLIRETGITGDTIKYWITDPLLMSNDSLTASLTYLKTNHLDIDSLVTDTLKLFFKSPKNKKNKAVANRQKTSSHSEENTDKNDSPQEDLVFLSISNNTSGTVDITAKLFLEFAEPIKDFSADKLRFWQGKDSLAVPITVPVLPDTLNPRKYWLQYKWKPGENYKMEADSATFHSYNNLFTNKITSSFQVKSEDQYGLLYLNIAGIPDSIPAFVELLDKSDKPIRKSIVKDNKVLFRYVNPGTYYVRLTLDANGNGKWDTGDYEQRLQPEMVYYNPKPYELKANWDSEDDWDVTLVPLYKQKALEITKNKPVEKKTKRQQLEEEEKKRKSTENQSNTFSGI